MYRGIGAMATRLTHSVSKFRITLGVQYLYVYLIGWMQTLDAHRIGAKMSPNSRIQTSKATTTSFLL